MKFRFLFLVSILLLTANIALAQKLTIDSVMHKVSKGKPFLLVFLKTGKPLPKDQAVVSKMQADHLVHLFQLERDGKISVFGPVSNDTSMIRGIIIFNSPDPEVARKDLDADPYIRQGYLEYELYNWFSIPGQKLR